MFNKRGFTLIELVIVIVVLGILAAVAVPKFFNLRGDAETAIVEGLKGALYESAGLVHAKASIDNLDKGNNILTVNGGDISIRAGYPRVANNCPKFTSQLQYWLTLDIDSNICQSGRDAEWYGVVQSNAFHFMPANYTSTAENCYVTYTTASEKVGGVWIDKDSATILIETFGCGK
ncbi:hypothetical protein GCM10007916_31880 [Psychromonas marina]|uniref:Prepilin-type N-terminal cleavage/methylation domain-containing protein n=1 Tax=Psychromonas marina TaxID=88364 RepID=A0ABQ6E3X9_9GAMM|nr:type II secretion system protein [Psychromonas marina]GLS92118.1 hypothetical protein GCM10007916_31880 [Psychromonas marina]